MVHRRALPPLANSRQPDGRMAESLSPQAVCRFLLQADTCGLRLRVAYDPETIAAGDYYCSGCAKHLFPTRLNLNLRERAGRASFWIHFA